MTHSRVQSDDQDSGAGGSLDQRLDAAFGQALSRAAIALDDYEQHNGSVLGLWPDGRIAYQNPAWFEFATANGGAPQLLVDYRLGAQSLDAASPALRPFYTALYGNVLATASIAEHVYECSSADVQRRFHMRVFPVGDGEGLMTVHALVIESAHPPADPDAVAPAIADYVGADGQVRQCCHCRRTQRSHDPNHWDFVPAFILRTPARTAHVLCPTCVAFYGRAETH